MLLNVHAGVNVGVFIKGSSMAEIEGLVRALREGDDDAKTAAAARLLREFACYSSTNRVLIAEAGGIPLLVELLRDGSAETKLEAARALGWVLYSTHANAALIAEAGGVPLLVELLRDGSADAKKSAVAALGNLTYSNAANKVLIACAGGIAPLVDFLRHSSSPPEAKTQAAQTLFNLANNNDANAVAIALAVGLEALVELARRGRVTVDNRYRVVYTAGIAAKRKAALVVAALLRACVPDELRSRADVQDAIRGVIGSYL